MYDDIFGGYAKYSMDFEKSKSGTTAVSSRAFTESNKTL
jgi:hypothetical protein